MTAHGRFLPALLAVITALAATLAISNARPACAQSKSPKETYLEYLRTVEKTTDFQDVAIFQTEKTRKPQKLSPEGVQMVKDSYPKNVRVLSEVIHGDTATIRADGTVSLKAFAPQINAMGTALQALSKTPMKPASLQRHATGTINFEKEGGEWKISENRWEGDDPNKPAPGTPAAIAADKAAAASASAAMSAGAWCTQALTKPFSNKPAFGKMFGVPFICEDAYVEEAVFSPTKKLTSIHLRKGPNNMPNDAEYIIAIPGPKESLPGKTIVNKPDTQFDATIQQPYVITNVNLGQPMPGPVNCKSQMYSVEKHFGMRVTFSQLRGDKLPGYIVLHLPDKEQSFVEGYFYATLRK